VPRHSKFDRWVNHLAPRRRQRAAQRRGLGTARDQLHGRVVKRQSVAEMAPPVTRHTAVHARAPMAVGPATPLDEHAVEHELASILSHENDNAPRSDAGWVRREINCTAGWASAGRSWRWRRRSLAIRRSTDERRAQTRGASKRVRGLQTLRTGRTRATMFAAARAQTGGASKRVRGLPKLSTGQNASNYFRRSVCGSFASVATHGEVPGE